MKSLLITCGHLVRHYPRFAAEIEGHGIAVTIPPVPGQQLDAAEMCAAIVGQRLVIAGDDVIDRSVLEAGKARWSPGNRQMGDRNGRHRQGGGARPRHCSLQHAGRVLR